MSTSGEERNMLGIGDGQENEMSLPGENEQETKTNTGMYKWID